MSLRAIAEVIHTFLVLPDSASQWDLSDCPCVACLLMWSVGKFTFSRHKTRL